MRVAIIGAGPTGLTIANQLVKNSINVDVYDSAPDVGGFAKSIELWGRKVEIGPHFLDAGNIPEVHDLVLDALDGKYTTYHRKTFILTGKKMFFYPPVISDIIKKMNARQLCLAAGGLIKQTVVPRKPTQTAEGFVTQYLGSHLYKYFFENFSKKLWGLHGSQVSDVFAKSLLGFSGGYSPLKIVLKKISKGFKTTVIQSKYVYPTNGLSTLWEALQAQIKAQGGNIRLSTSIKEMACITAADKISHLFLNDGLIEEYDQVISTIPVLPLLSYFRNTKGGYIKPEGFIKFRSDILIYLKVQFDTAVVGQCFYCYSEEIKITRITNFDGFTPDQHTDFSIILLEFWCSDEDELWYLNDEKLLAMAISELDKTGIFTGLKVLDNNIKKIKNAFQIPDLELIENREKLFEQLSVYKNLHITGRNASVNFNYGMENAIKDGIQLADDFLAAIKVEQLEKA
jgi:protoporphyrinogen oxidase